jgi:predicted glycoside hydrolase/deacetylase ChbG (UPF0249 family)
MVIPSNIIINADDFGANSTINLAISKCFALGIINSTSMIANMKGFDDAIRMCKDNGFQDKIGLHVNLTAGKALTDLSKTKLVDEEGIFIKKKVNKKCIYLSHEVNKLVNTEIEAQLNALYVNNITPTHINSHHHVHTFPWLAPTFIKVANKFNLKIRIAQTWNENNNILVPTYRFILNWLYKRYKINFTSRFETFESYNNAVSGIKNINYLTEIMVHPDLNSESEIYDSFDGSNLEKILNSIRNLAL